HLAGSGPRLQGARARGSRRRQARRDDARPYRPGPHGPVRVPVRRVLWQRARGHGRRVGRRRLERHAAMRPDPMIDSTLGSPEGPGVVPETILPEQFFRPSAALPPEQRLMLAVLEAALLDLLRSAAIGTPRARRLLAEVDAWFAADGEDWPFSFVN